MEQQIERRKRQQDHLHVMPVELFPQLCSEPADHRAPAQVVLARRVDIIQQFCTTRTDIG
jgi:hypothetical protein